MATDFATLHRDVRRALRDRLKTSPYYTGPALVDWEGGDFKTPLTAVTFWRERLKPVTGITRSLGPNALIRHRGTYLVDVYVASGKGNKEADLQAGSILTVFPLDLQLVHNGRVVTIDGAGRDGGRVDTLWLHVPITVSW